MRARLCSFCSPLVAIVTLLCLAGAPMQAQTSLQIHDIMANLPNSPYLGQSVSVSGIIVGVMSTGGFYFSEPSGSWDSLVATAEGMPVFYAAGANPACAVVGNVVTVVGTVTNTTALTAADTPGTGIAPTSCTVTGTGTMTQAISLSSVLTSFGDALKYTGMAASNTTFYAISPTGGTLTEATETVASNGQFWATLSSNATTNNHLFRAAGIAGDEYVPSTAPSTVTKWAGNPQRILIDTATFGGTPIDITVGQGITCAVPSNIALGATKGIGLIDYTLGYARLLIFKTSVCTVSGTVAPTVSAAADATHFQVGTLDLDRFYSTTGATAGSVAISADAYARRLAKAAQAVVTSLGAPDILSVQEVQDLATLTDLAGSVSTLAGTTYQPYLIQGGDSASLNLGFLVKASTINVDTVEQVGASDTYTASSGAATLWERPPLVLTAEVHRTGKTYPVTVIDVHLTPRDNIGSTTLGADVRAHRAAQAAALSALAQGYQAAGQNVLVDGNFNAFQYNDGYVDVLGVVTGSPAAASEVTLYQATATTAALTNFTNDIAANQNYNLLERGQAESVEHILASATVTASNTASASLASYETAVVQPHFSADFAAVNANSATTAAGLTPHDGEVVSFLIPPVPTTASISSAAINFGNVTIGASATQTITITNTTTFASTVNVTNIAISGTNAADFSQSSTCSSLAEGAGCTITLTFTPTATGTRSGLLTVTTDSGSDPTLTATLTGVGVATTATLSPTTANFGSVVLGSTSAAQTFLWTNTSTVPLTVSTPAISGDYNVAANSCSGTIAAGATCSVSVTFSPAALGTRTGALTIRSNSSANATLTAALTGVGVSAISASPAALSFGNIDLGSSSGIQVITVTNNSSAATAISGVAVTGDYAETTTCVGALAAKATCAISVRFTPTATGIRAGVVSILVGTAAAASVTLTGNGVDFSIALAPTTGSMIAGNGTVTPVATLTPLGGFDAAVTVSCLTDAVASTCTPASSSLTLAASVTDKVAISTTSEYTVVGYGAVGGRGRIALLLALLVFVSGTLVQAARGRVSVGVRLALLLIALGGVSMGITGCSGKLPGMNSPYTEPGTYTYTVTATDGTLTHSATYTLAVRAK